MGDLVLGRSIGIIEGRLGSRGLPGTLLAPLGGRPLLACLVARLRYARIDEWWLATTGEPADDVSEAWGFELGLRVHRSDPSDLLSPLVAVARESSAEWIVRVRGDTPFVDAPLVDALLDGRDESEEAKSADRLQIGGFGPQDGPEEDGLPRGYAAELLRGEAIARFEHGRARPERARVPQAPDLTRDETTFRVPVPRSWPARPHWHWLIESYADLAMARSAFRVFGPDATSIDFPAMVSRIDAHPEIAALNAAAPP